LITVRRPSAELVQRFKDAQTKFDFTYPGVGATSGSAATPSGFVVDNTSVVLGTGRECFARAKAALERWEQFNLGWLHAAPADTPIRVDETVLVVAHYVRLWWINAARIVYVINEDSLDRLRFGFAYGTLPGHVEMGEERFLIEWDRATDEVTYDILAFSRPRHILTRFAKRQARRMQKRFAEHSAAAMRRAVEAVTK